MCALITVARALACALVAGGAVAAGPSTLPQVRVVQDMHTAAIDQVRTDVRFERLVTVSRDKTVRLWRLADLQPLRSVPLPAEPGPEGTPYSVAISADGAWVYAAGYTGHAWHQASHVYRIDAAAGRITGTLGHFPDDVVTALDLSPDGRRLAVGLGRSGLVVIDSRSGAVLWKDTAYAGAVSFVHHAPDGRLASASADGCLRVHGVDGTLGYRLQYPPRPQEATQCTGGDLGGVRFSPDGRWLALGHKGLPEVPLFDGRTLALVRVLRGDDPLQRSLCCIAWSPDSRALFVNGNLDGEDTTALYAVRDLAAGPVQRLRVNRQAFSNMLPMPDGTMVLATPAPSLLRVNAEGRDVARPDGRPLAAEPDNIDFHRTRGTPSALRVRADGGAVAFEDRPGHWLRLDPLGRAADRVLAKSDGPPEGLLPAVRDGPVAVSADTALYGHRQPVRVGGRDVVLSVGEGVRSWSVHRTRRIAALGTQWRLLLLDGDARPLPGWESPPFLPAPAYHTVLSGDGRWVVVGLGDGTLRWFDVATGRERLAAFVHANARDWIVWRPDGYYASSPEGDRYLGWLVNRGEETTPDLWRAEQFEREFYRPDLLRGAMQAEAGADDRFAATLRDQAPPRVHIESIDTAPGGGATVRFTAESTGRPLREVGVYVDSIPVLPAGQRTVTGKADRITRTVTLPWRPQPGRVRVEAETGVALGIDETSPLRPMPASAVAPRPTLWLVAVGVHRFDRLPDVVPLPTATNDAVELAKTLSGQKGRAFADVRASVLVEGSPNPPTRANLLASLDALQGMAPHDTLVVFIASHGAADAAEYYVMAKDSDPADVARLSSAQAAGGRVSGGPLSSLLSGTELTLALRRLPGRRIVILDTCQSGAVNQSDPQSLFKRSAAARIAVMSAAQGDEASYDSPTEPHGAFTAALIRALASPDASAGPTTLRIAFERVKPEVAQVVARLRETRRGAARDRIRQTPTLTGPAAVEAAVLAAR